MPSLFIINQAYFSEDVSDAAVNSNASIASLLSAFGL